MKGFLLPAMVLIGWYSILYGPITVYLKRPKAQIDPWVISGGVLFLLFSLLLIFLPDLPSAQMAKVQTVFCLVLAGLSFGRMRRMRAQAS